jgi:TolB-like protein/DNA-binding response OmpR family regulator
MNTRILVVAHDPGVRAMLARLLAPEGCAVELAEGTKRAREILAAGPIALAFLAPDRLGGATPELARELRDAAGALIIIAEGPHNAEQLNKYRRDGDTFLTKPLDEREVLTRTRAALRQPADREEAAAPAGQILRFDGLTLDIMGYSALDGRGREVSLTRAEFALLLVFARHSGQVLSRDRLLDLTTDRRADPFDRSIDFMVSRIRQKIEPDPKTPRMILTIPGVGYKFAARALPTEAPTVDARLSIVALPFANLGDDVEQEYFVDGITENLTTDLSRIPGAFVIARNTAFTFKGKSVDVRKVARELGVRYVLEGSVQRGGNRLRVNVQLIDAEIGKHLWAERFDKPLADLFDMQDEIVARLANQLGTELFAAEARRAERAPHPDSMDLFFQGMACTHKGRVPEYMAQARGLFERALALDPGNIEALVGAAAVDVQSAGWFMTDERTARLAAVEATLTRVLSLAPNHAMAHYLLGFVQMYTNRAAQGIAECERALTLDRNLAAAHGEISLAKYFIGRSVEAESHVHEALRLSPRDTNAYVWLTHAGFAKLALGADEEAAAQFCRAIETNRNFPLAHFALAAAMALLGRLDDARAAARAGLALDPAFTVSRYRAGASSDNPTYLARRERIAESMRKAGVPER